MCFFYRIKPLVYIFWYSFELFRCPKKLGFRFPGARAFGFNTVSYIDTSNDWKLLDFPWKKETFFIPWYFLIYFFFKNIVLMVWRLINNKWYIFILIDLGLFVCLINNRCKIFIFVDLGLFVCLINNRWYIFILIDLGLFVCLINNRWYIFILIDSGMLVFGFCIEFVLYTCFS